MQLAQRLDRFKPSATLAINAKALELKAKGINVVSLAVGEPDFPTPPHICEAAKQAIDAGHSRYTDVAGIAPLRQAVAGYYKRTYDVSATADNVIICNGGKQTLYNLLLVLLNPGDEVIIPAPYWVSYPDMVALADGTPVFVPTDAASHFKPTVAQLEAARTPRTRVLIFNSPSNPTGAVFSAAETTATLEWALEHDIFVIADEIYDQLVFSPATMTSTATWWAKHPEHIAIANGLSKSFAMTGWRLGHTLAHPALIKAMAKIQGQTTSNVCAIAQHAAVAALNGPIEPVISMRDAFSRRRDMAWNEIATWPGVICPRPDGAFYLFLDVSACLKPEIPDTPTLCTRLLEQAHVATVPGDVFGAPGCLRLSYAVDDASLMLALSKIKAILFG